MAKRQSTLDQFIFGSKVPKLAPELPDIGSSNDEIGSDSDDNHIVESSESRQGTPPQSDLIERLDIGQYIGQSVTDSTKLELLQNPWSPGDNFKFPPVKVGNRNRYFSRKYLNDFKWLAYSNILPGGFCRFCVLFVNDKTGQGKGGHQELRAFVTEAAAGCKLSVSIFI